MRGRVAATKARRAPPGVPIGVGWVVAGRVGLHFGVCAVVLDLRDEAQGVGEGPKLLVDVAQPEARGGGNVAAHGGHLM